MLSFEMCHFPMTFGDLERSLQNMKSSPEELSRKKSRMLAH